MIIKTYFSKNLYLIMHPLQHYQEIIQQKFESHNFKSEPLNLYEPVDYILSLGGKRIRPVLTLMATDVFDGNIQDAIPAAMAVEVFHNFSLVHDDIMDDAPLRRGKHTVHEKWNINTGILSGDAMLILAYQYFENYAPEKFVALAKLFSKTALEVCEGQQYDVDFETREDVTIPEYLKMIAYKTAVLLGTAMQMGAIIADTTDENAQLIYDFGLNLGIAFQLQDDYLDAFGDTATFGKQIGGDIIENKKTFLFLHAMQNANEDQKRQLSHLYSIKTNNNNEKIMLVKQIFEEVGATTITQNAIAEYTNKAFGLLENMAISDEKKQVLKMFGIGLMNRKI
jgi:geranylgeranyl diphosphate synthase, type II